MDWCWDTEFWCVVDEIYHVWSTLNEIQRGFFKEIKNSSEKVLTGVTKIEKSFTNYCGLGIDARIGWSFDKRRSKSRAVNLLIYAWIGLVKSCHRRIKMYDMIHDMEQYVSFPGSMLNSANLTKQTMMNNYQEGGSKMTNLAKSVVFVN